MRYAGSIWLFCLLLPVWLIVSGSLLHATGLFDGLFPPEAPLPRYQLSLQGREGAHYAKLSMDDTLRISLRPEVGVQDPLSLRALLHPHEGGSPDEAWPIVFERQEGGGLLLQAPVHVLPGLRPGRWGLTLLIERPPRLRRLFSPRTCADTPDCRSVEILLELTSERE